MGGGKGELSLLLSLRGHACALVDPRPSAGYLSKKHRKQVHTMAYRGAWRIARCMAQCVARGMAHCLVHYMDMVRGHGHGALHGA